MNWNTLSSEADLKTAIKNSYNTLTALFKHSTTCPISGMAKMRVEENIEDLSDTVTFYYLDLLNYRAISNLIAERLQVHHESPQLILLKDGEVIHDASHFDITIKELNEVIQHQTSI